jgi:hypothetical protein
MVRLMPALVLVLVATAVVHGSVDWLWPATYTANYAGLAGQTW